MIALLMLALIGCGTGSDDRGGRPGVSKRVKAKKAGRVGKAGKGKGLGRFMEPVDAPEDDLEALAALGYVDGSEAAPTESGAQVLVPERIQPGANLYVSGQGPEAHLIDRDGKVLHKWAYDWFAQWPRPERHGEGEFPNHWRRAHLYENGDLIVIWGGQGMAKLDKDSRFLWGTNTEHIHHDVDVGPDGRVWTLSRRPMEVPSVTEDRQVVMDSIVTYSPEGEKLDEFTLIECFENSPHRRWIPVMLDRGDVLHTNTITVLPEGFQNPEFKAGNLLVSFRHLHAVATIDPVKRTVEWLRRGSWGHQHQPVLLSDETVLLFDNRGLGERSRVLEFEARTGKITWSYGEEPGQFFYSRVLGSVQRLDNGNTLITASNNGRAFEITREGERVWEYVVPHRAGPDDAYIATLYELVRLPPDFELGWADPSTVERAVMAAPPVE